MAVVNEKGRSGGVCQSVKRMSTGLMFFRLLALIFVANKIFFVKAIFCFHCNLFPHESATVCPGNKVVNFGWQFDVSLFEEKYSHLKRSSIVFGVHWWYSEILSSSSSLV